MTRIRAARRDEARAIAGIEVDGWRAAYAGILPDRVLVRMSRSRQALSWARELAQGNDVVLVASEPGGLVGFGSCGTQRLSGAGYAGEVYTLYVAQDAQNRGVGRLLLRGLFRTLLDAGHDSALIWVLRANPSRFFYERLGGRAVLERPIPVGGEPIDAVAYGWSDLRATLGVPAR